MISGVEESEGLVVVFFQAEDGIRDLVRSRGLGDVYKRQVLAAVDHARDPTFAPQLVDLLAGDFARFCFDYNSLAHASVFLPGATAKQVRRALVRPTCSVIFLTKRLVGYNQGLATCVAGNFCLAQPNSEV